jgi:hypothetical protein
VPLFLLFHLLRQSAAISKGKTKKQRQLHLRFQTQNCPKSVSYLRRSPPAPAPPAAAAPSPGMGQYRLFSQCRSQPHGLATQIRATHRPHRLRRYVRALEQRLSARRAPAVVLRLTRPQVEVNPLAEFVGDDEAAMRGPPRANRMAFNASCSEFKATRRAAGARGYRKGTSRYAYDIHRQMGPQRVHSRPTFHYGASNRQRCPVRHEVHVTDGRAKSTAERLEIFACTGVPASEYEVLLPGGMRREALEAGSTHACYQERIDLVQRSRRESPRDPGRKARLERRQERRQAPRGSGLICINANKSQAYLRRSRSLGSRLFLSWD